MPKENLDFALITCNELKDLTEHDKLLRDSLRASGYSCQAIVWDDETIDWCSVKVAVMRSAWDYHLKTKAFLNWLDEISGQTILVNGPEIIRWNITKFYLQQLHQFGINIVPTIFLRQNQSSDLGQITKENNWHDIVIKPAVGMSSDNVLRISNLQHITNGQAHLQKLLARGDALIQQYLPSVEKYGERNLVFIDQQFSHGIQKNRLLNQDSELRDIFISPSKHEIDFAKKILQKIIPAPYYARVDLLIDRDDQPCLLELELIDPNLFFKLYPPAVEIFAKNLSHFLQNKSK